MECTSAVVVSILVLLVIQAIIWMFISARYEKIHVSHSSNIAVQIQGVSDINTASADKGVAVVLPTTTARLRQSDTTSRWADRGTGRGSREVGKTA